MRHQGVRVFPFIFIVESTLDVFFYPPLIPSTRLLTLSPSSQQQYLLPWVMHICAHILCLISSCPALSPVACFHVSGSVSLISLFCSLAATEE